MHFEIARSFSRLGKSCEAVPFIRSLQNQFRTCSGWSHCTIGCLTIPHQHFSSLLSPFKWWLPCKLIRSGSTRTQMGQFCLSIATQLLCPRLFHQGRSSNKRKTQLHTHHTLLFFFQILAVAQFGSVTLSIFSVWKKKQDCLTSFHQSHAWPQLLKQIALRRYPNWSTSWVV